MSTSVSLLGVGILGWVLGWVILRLAGLRSHEESHCHQLGELQYIVAVLARHVDAATVGGLPSDVEEHVRGILDGD